MGFSLRSGSNIESTESGPDSLDIYSRGAMQKRWPGVDEYFQVTADDAEKGTNDAMRYLLSRLYGDAGLRVRFPRALTEGRDGVFAGWLTEGVSPRTGDHLKAALDAASGTRILDFYLRRPDLHRELPGSLIHGAQKRWVRWLFDHGREEVGFLESEILGFLRLTAESPAAFLTTTYLLQPEWQTKFPNALAPGKEQPFLEWVDSTFRPAKVTPLPKGTFPVSYQGHSSELGETAPLLARTPFQWQPAKRPTWRWWTRSTKETPGANILGPFCFSGGVGEAARTTAGALESVGFSVSCRDIPGAPTHTPRTDYLGPEIHPTTLIHALPDDPMPVLYRHVGWPLDAGKKRIGIWYWELEALPPEWAGNEAGLHEVWAPTEFIAEALRSQILLPVVKMLPAVRTSVAKPMSRRELGLPEGRFLFLFMFDMASTFERKNPLAVVEAFRKAAPSNASLVIKVSRGHFEPKAMARLIAEAEKAGALIVDEVWSREKIQALIGACDCYVSLHRSEGFGLPMAEAMLQGKPVISSRYSGNLDFMNDGNSLLVDCGRVCVSEDVRIYPAGSVWGDPSVDQAADHMRRVVEEPMLARALGERAREECSVLLSPEAYGQRMKKRLAEVQTGLSENPRSGIA